MKGLRLRLRQGKDRDVYKIIKKPSESGESELGYGFTRINVMKLKRGITSFFSIIIIIFTFLFLSCGDNQETGKPRPAPAHSNSFTFFDIGKNTIVSGNVREGLNKTLGDDSIERRSILDLEINYDGFLKDYFPDLDTLNKKLNSPPGERVEHNTVKLMYRYMKNKSDSFKYVELVYSKYTQTPVLIRVHLKKDALNTIATIKQKYGIAEIINWDGESAKSLYWKNDNDLLIISFVPDQFGKPEHQIVIYFKDALENLLQDEQKEKEKRNQEGTPSGKTAF